MTTKQIGILGYGRFGRVLCDLLKDDFQVLVYDRQEDLVPESLRSTVEAVASRDILLICVPILTLDSAAASIAPHVPAHTTVMDVCSVKLYARQVLERYFPKNPVLPAHPMFGPDSVSKANGARGLPFILCPTDQTPAHCVDFWKTYLKGKGLKVFCMTCDQHDRHTAYSLGLTFLTSRILEPILDIRDDDSENGKRLRSVVDVCCHDTAELFEGLLSRNPYATQMRRRFREQLDAIETQLDTMTGRL